MCDVGVGRALGHRELASVRRMRNGGPTIFPRRGIEEFCSVLAPTALRFCEPIVSSRTPLIRAGHRQFPEPAVFFRAHELLVHKTRELINWPRVSNKGCPSCIGPPPGGPGTRAKEAALAILYRAVCVIWNIHRPGFPSRISRAGSRPRAPPDHSGAELRRAYGSSHKRYKDSGFVTPFLGGGNSTEIVRANTWFGAPNWFSFPFVPEQSRQMFLSKASNCARPLFLAEPATKTISTAHAETSLSLAGSSQMALFSLDNNRNTTA